MNSLDDRIRQFKHLIGDGKLVAMATFVEVHDDGIDERCIELHLAFEDQTLNPHGTGTWIVNSTTVCPGDDWQTTCDGAIDAAEEFYTDLLKFRGGGSAKKSRSLPNGRQAHVILMVTPDARPHLIEAIRPALETFQSPYSAQIITDDKAGSAAWETWWFGTDTYREAQVLFDGLSTALAGSKQNGTMPPCMQWVGCVIADPRGDEQSK